MEHTITDWRNQAACTGSEPELWFALNGTDDHAMAREICEGCPVRRACGAFAHRTGQASGIWAGFDVVHQRRAFRVCLVAQGVIKAPPTCSQCGEELTGPGRSPVCGPCRQGMVPAAKYAAYVADLLASGWTVTAIARQTGAPYGAISKLKRGVERVTQTAATALDAAMAVTA